MKKDQNKEQKQGTSIGFKIYSFFFFVIFFIVPFSIANFVDGGDEFLKSVVGPIVVSLIISLLINWFLWSKHITAIENEDADSYVKKDNIEITYRYDEYTHTT